MTVLVWIQLKKLESREVTGDLWRTINVVGQFISGDKSTWIWILIVDQAGFIRNVVGVCSFFVAHVYLGRVCNIIVGCFSKRSYGLACRIPNISIRKKQIQQVTPTAYRKKPQHSLNHLFMKNVVLLHLDLGIQKHRVCFQGDLL